VHLSLIATLREVCAAPPDRRQGRNRHHAMAGIGLAAFAVFFMQSPSFLAHQRRLQEGHGRSNCQAFFNHLRSITVFLLFPSWYHLLATLAFEQPPPRPP
jgi:hypothetical protein